MGARPVFHRAAAAAVATLVLASGLVAGAVSPVRADDVRSRKNALDGQIAQLQDDLEGASADLVAAAVALKRSQTRLAQLQVSLAAARAALDAAQRVDDEVAARLAFATAEQDKAVRGLAQQQRAEASSRSQLGRMARQAYQGNSFTGLQIALGAADPNQLTDRLTLAQSVMREQSQAIDRLQVEQADQRAQTAKLAAIRQQVAVLKQQSAAAVAARQAAQAALAAQQREQAALVAAQARAVVTIRAKLAAERARLDQAQREQAQLQAILVARARAAAAAAAAAARRRAQAGGGRGGGGGGGSSFVPRGGGVLSYPANGPITSGYGRRFHPILHIWRMHAGTDFGIACGTPVHAAADGDVVRAGRAGGFGNQVVIDHGIIGGADLASSYNHLSRIVVHGGHVRRGQLIAYSGTTGLSTGCHLHFEVYRNGSTVNPMSWL